MKPKPLSKDDILRAMRFTQSGHAAARYLGVSYQHYRPWAKLYKDDETGLSLFALQKNQSGVGIAKRLKNTVRRPDLRQIITKGTGWEAYSASKMKEALIFEGYLREECYKCGHHESRVSDGRHPVILNHKDGNKVNWLLTNLEMLCYNCTFLYGGHSQAGVDVFANHHIEAIETTNEYGKGPKVVDEELNEAQLENMRALGIL